MGTIKINNIVYGSNNASEIIYKSQTVEEKLDTIPIFDINDNGNVDNNGSDVLTYGHIIDSLNSDAVDKVLSAKQGKVLNNKIDNIDFSPLENSISSLENELEESINNLDTKITEFQNTFLNLVYPIGAVYLSLSSTNPGTLFGGTWEQLKDRFLLGAGDSYSVGGTGGAATHTHNYGLQYGGYYRSVSLESNTNAGILTYDTNNTISLVSGGVSQGTLEGPINQNATNGMTTVSMAHYRQTANTSYTNNMPPYLTVYMWKRVS